MSLGSSPYQLRAQVAPKQKAKKEKDMKRNSNWTAVRTAFLLLAAFAAASNVNVVNTPTVNIGGTSAPLPVKDADNPARQPFHYEASFQIANFNVANAATVPVPPGKRLVIEQVSALATVPAASGEVPSIEVTAVGGGAEARSFVPMTYVGRHAFGDEAAATAGLRMYADPGSSVILKVDRSLDITGNNTGTVSVFISATGYLVNLP